MKMAYWNHFLALSAILGIFSTGCDYAEDVVAEMVLATTQGNLHEFQEQFTVRAREKLATPEMMAHLKDLYNKSVEGHYGMDLLMGDQAIQIGDKRHITQNAYLAIKLNDQRVKWFTFYTLCTGTPVAIGDGPTKATSCLISDFEERDLSISISDAEGILIAHSCSYQAEDFIKKHPDYDPRVSAYPGTPSALEIVVANHVRSSNCGNVSRVFLKQDKKIHP